MSFGSGLALLSVYYLDYTDSKGCLDIGDDDILAREALLYLQSHNAEAYCMVSFQGIGCCANRSHFWMSTNWLSRHIWLPLSASIIP